jgi:hypothetical protein
VRATTGRPVPNKPGEDERGREGEDIGPDGLQGRKEGSCIQLSDIRRGPASKGERRSVLFDGREFSFCWAGTSHGHPYAEVLADTCRGMRGVADPGVLAKSTLSGGWMEGGGKCNLGNMGKGRGKECPPLASPSC